MIRLVKSWRFLRNGFKAKKFIFFLDIMKYIFSAGGCRAIPLSSPSLGMDMQLKTLFKYAAEKKTTANFTKRTRKTDESVIH